MNATTIAKYFDFRRTKAWRLPERMIHTLMLVAIPLFCRGLFDLWNEGRGDPFFGTPAVVAGLSGAVLTDLSTAVVIAALEHLLVIRFRKHRIKQGRDYACGAHSPCPSQVPPPGME